MPVLGLGRSSDLLSTHNGQLPEHGIASAFSSPILSTVAMSASTIGQAVGVISSSTQLPPAALPMPTSLGTTSKQLSGSKRDVVCPLPNLDGSACRKKCSGTFAYRSICEHIRRAHPEHWIPKLPASAESFHKMIQTPPVPKGATVQQGPGINGGSQAGTIGIAPKRSTTGSGLKSRAKVLKAKTNTDDQDIEDMSPPVSTPESESQVSSPMLSESKDLYTHEIPQSIVASETDTESDNTHSPVSPPSLSVLSTPTLPAPSTKLSSIAKSKATSSRKKASSNPGSKTKSSPRKVTTRRRTVDKKSSSSALASLYSTSAVTNHDLSSLAAGVDMMDVDTDLTPRQHYVFGHQNGDMRYGNRYDFREDDMDEVGLILGGMAKAPQHSSTFNQGGPHLRRAYSFSVGDTNGPTGSVANGGRARGALAVNTNIAFEHDKSNMQSGSMSAGGILSTASNGGLSWDDLIEAAKAATEENKVPEKKSPLLYQSVLPTVSGGAHTPRRNMNPYGPDLPPSLKMMIDIASAEADLNQIHRQQQSSPQYQHAHPQNYMNNYAHTQHQYITPANMYPPCPQHPYAANSYHPYHTYSSGHSIIHTNISPLLNGTSLVSLNSSNATSHASTPAYSKPSSPRVEGAQNSPKVQCSLCRTYVDISTSLVCTECIYGFCSGCVPHYEASENVGENVGELSKMKLGSSPELEPQQVDRLSKKQSSANGRKPRTKCGVCGVVGARYKPVNLIVHA